MKNSEFNNEHRRKMVKLRLFIHFVIQLQDIFRWNMNETQRHNMCTWIDATMGIQLLVNLCSSGKLDKCEVTFIYSKYC